MPLAEAKTILVLGDSLSAGYNMSAAEGWVNLLSQRLTQDKVINASISGATSAQGLQLLPGLLKQYQPDVLILELGANDGLQGKPITTIKSNLEQLIRLAQAAKTHIVLVGIRLPPNLGKRYTEPFFAQYGELAEQFNLPYLPFLLDGIAGKETLMQADGLHPKAEAQEKVLENIWPLIEKR